MNNFIKNVLPSPTLALASKARQLRSEGKDVISFTVGEPDFGPPEHVQEAAINAIKLGYSKYTDVAGIYPLRAAICEKFAKSHHLSFEPKDIIVTNGGKQALATAISVLINEGDEVVIPAPYWTSYPDMVKLVGGRAVIVQTKIENGYLMQPEELAAVITEKTKIVIINSPSNPTGACYDETTLRALADVILSQKNEIFVLSDEVYEDFKFDGEKNCSIATVLPAMKERTIIINAFSKSYAMTGWRVGYAVGRRDIIDAMVTHQSQWTSNVCSIAQYAASVAYNDGGVFPRKMREEFGKRLDLVNAYVAKMNGVTLPFVPKGAFYAFLRIDEIIGTKYQGMEIKNSRDFAQYLLDKYEIVTVPGEAFGDDKAIRISYAISSAELEHALKRLTEAVNSR